MQCSQAWAAWRTYRLIAHAVPVCLPQLTSLVELKLEEVGLDMEADEVQAAVEDALQQLTGVSTWAAAGWLAGRQTGCGQPLRTLMLAS